MLKNVTIIGAGRLGSSLQKLFKRAGAKVSIWDKENSKVSKKISLIEAVSSAEAVFLCVPSFALDDVLLEIKKHIRKNCIIVSPIKGIDHETGDTTVEVVTKLVPSQPLVILGGPMIAEELDKNLGGTSAVASVDKKAAKLVGSLLIKAGVNVVYSSDTHGVALAGVLKNAYALSLGIAEGLGWGMNLKGSLITQALFEMQVFLFASGSKPETAVGAAGLGDLIATGFSEDSRNHQVGFEMARGKKPKFKGEGGLSLPSLLSFIKRKNKSLSAFPLLVATEKVVSGKMSAEKAFKPFRSNGEK